MRDFGIQLEETPKRELGLWRWLRSASISGETDSSHKRDEMKLWNRCEIAHPARNGSAHIRIPRDDAALSASLAPLARPHVVALIFFLFLDVRVILLIIVFFVSIVVVVRIRGASQRGDAR